MPEKEEEHLMIFAILPLLPTAPVQGVNVMMFGKRVKVDQVKVEDLGRASAGSGKDKDVADVFVLSFQEGTDFIADKVIKFHFHKSVGKSWDGFSWDQPATKFGTEAHSKSMHGHTKGNSCGRGAVAAFLNYDEQGQKSKNEASSDLIRFKFTSKKLPNGKYLGSIDATVAEHKAVVRGQFLFTPSKFGTR